MKNLKVFVLLLTSAIFCNNSNACGGWEEYNTYFRLFKPEYMIAGKEFASITYVDEPWSNISPWFPSKNEHDENIELWKAYFPVFFEDEALNKFIYKIKEDEIQRAKNNNHQTKNEVLKWVVKNKDTKIIDYLLFAKKCEQYCNPAVDYYWQEPVEKDLTVFPSIIKNGKELYQRCDNKFLKERYGFQLIKLMRHAELYDECLNFWNNELIGNTKSIIYYWTLDHIAGVQLKQGKKTEAWKNFMEVFQNSQGKRFSSYCSIKIQSDSDWNALLDACDTRKQKETMYFMRASQLGSVALSDIDSLYQVNPNSAYLPILICREINKIESILLQTNEDENVFYQNYFNNKNINSELSEYLEEFNAFLTKGISDKQIKNQVFWQVSNLYTGFLMQDFYKVREQMALLSEQLPKGIDKQVSIIENLLLITDKGKTPVQRQNQLKQIWNPEVKDFAYFFMCHSSNKLPYPLNSGERMYQLRLKLDTKKLEALVDLAYSQNELTWFANYILENHYTNDTEYLSEMLGTSYLADGETEKAITVFSGLSEAYKASSKSFYLVANPFNYLINDRHSYTLKKVKYSKLKLVQVLSTLTKAINAGTATAMDYYLLGNAQYNTSYFGYVWNAKAYYWSGGHYTTNFDCSKAYHNYLKAAELADDREMQAKCYYLAAKANQNMYLTDHIKYAYLKVDFNEEQMFSGGYRKELIKLKAYYKDTEFYSRIIEECKYFQFYTN